MKKKKALAAVLTIAAVGTAAYMAYAYSAVQQLREDLKEDIKNMNNDKE